MKKLYIKKKKKTSFHIRIYFLNWFHTLLNRLSLEKGIYICLFMFTLHLRIHFLFIHFSHRIQNQQQQQKGAN